MIPLCSKDKRYPTTPFRYSSIEATLNSRVGSRRLKTAGKPDRGSAADQYPPPSKIIHNFVITAYLHIRSITLSSHKTVGVENHRATSYKVLIGFSRNIYSPSDTTRLQCKSPSFCPSQYNRIDCGKERERSCSVIHL